MYEFHRGEIDALGKITHAIGNSVGELSALSIAQMLDINETLAVLESRGELLESFFKEHECELIQTA